MHFHGAQGDAQSIGNRLAAHPLGHQFQYFGFAPAELFEQGSFWIRVSGAGGESAGDGVEQLIGVHRFQ